MYYMRNSYVLYKRPLYTTIETLTLYIRFSQINHRKFRCLTHIPAIRQKNKKSSSQMSVLFPSPLFSASYFRLCPDIVRYVSIYPSPFARNKR